MAKAKGKSFGQRMVELKKAKAKQEADAKLLENYPTLNVSQQMDAAYTLAPLAPEQFLEQRPPAPNQTPLDRAIQTLREKSQGI